MSQLSVKGFYNATVHRFPLPNLVSIEFFKTYLTSVFDLDMPFSVFYIDDEGDRVSVVGEKDLSELYRIATSLRQFPLHLHVYDEYYESGQDDEGDKDDNDEAIERSQDQSEDSDPDAEIHGIRQASDIKPNNENKENYKSPESNNDSGLAHRYINHKHGQVFEIISDLALVLSAIVEEDLPCPRAPRERRPRTLPPPTYVPSTRPASAKPSSTIRPARVPYRHRRS